MLNYYRPQNQPLQIGLTIAHYTKLSTLMHHGSGKTSPHYDDQPSCKRTVRVEVPSPTHSLDNRSYRTISDLQWEVTGMAASFTLFLLHDLLDNHQMAPQ